VVSATRALFHQFELKRKHTAYAYRPGMESGLTLASLAFEESTTRHRLDRRSLLPLAAGRDAGRGLRNLP
jgi:hypothetical protein